MGGLRELLGRFGEVVHCSEMRLTSLPAPAAHVQFSTSKARMHTERVSRRVFKLALWFAACIASQRQ